MGKEQFLSELREALLGRLPEQEVREILEDYADFFAAGQEEGKTEQQVADQFGDPARIALSLLSKEYATDVSTVDTKAPIYRRLLAIIIDLMLASLPLLVVAPRIGITGFFFPQLVPMLLSSFWSTIQVSSHWWIEVAGPFWHAGLIMSGIWFFLLNALSLIVLRGQTIGKRLMQLKVVSENGYQAKAGQYVARELLGKLVLNAVCGLIWAPLAFLPSLVSLVWCILSPDGKTVWDALSNTSVAVVSMGQPGN